MVYKISLKEYKDEQICGKGSIYSPFAWNVWPVIKSMKNIYNFQDVGNDISVQESYYKWKQVWSSGHKGKGRIKS